MPGGGAAYRRWQHLVGDVAVPANQAAIKINADANIYATEIAPGAAVEMTLAPGRQAYLLCMEGAAAVDSQGQAMGSMVRHDAARVGAGGAGGHVRVAAQGAEVAHMLMVEMAARR